MKEKIEGGFSKQRMQRIIDNYKEIIEFNIKMKRLMPKIRYITEKYGDIKESDLK